MFQHARTVQAALDLWSLCLQRMQSSSLALDLWSLATKGTQELLRRRPFSLVSTSKVTKYYSLFMDKAFLPPPDFNTV